MQPATHLQGKAFFSHSLPLLLLPIHVKLSALFSVASILIIATAGRTVATRYPPCPPATAISWDLNIPAHQARHVPPLHSLTACSCCVFQTHLTAKHPTLNSCYCAKIVFQTHGDMNKIQLSRGELSNVPPYTGPKKPRKGWETVALLLFFCSSQKYGKSAEKFYINHKQVIFCSQRYIYDTH